MLEMLKPGTVVRPDDADVARVHADIMRRYHAVNLEDVDFVPPAMPYIANAAKLYMIEDNDAVIKMLAKGRAPVLKHCSRTQRVDLDFLFEQLKDDPAILCRYIHTSHQIADILTKGVFTAETWCRLCGLLRLGPPPAPPAFIDDTVRPKMVSHAVSYYGKGGFDYSKVPKMLRYLL